MRTARTLRPLSTGTVHVEEQQKDAGMILRIQ